MSASHLPSVERARRRADAARVAFEQAIREAHGAGLSVRAIAPAAGLSYQRVWQILHGK